MAKCQLYLVLAREKVVLANQTPQLADAKTVKLANECDGNCHYVCERS